MAPPARRDRPRVTIERTWRAGRGHGVEFKYVRTETPGGKPVVTLTATGVASGRSTTRVLGAH